MLNNDQEPLVTVTDEEVMAEIEKDRGVTPPEETPEKEEQPKTEEPVPKEEEETEEEVEEEEESLDEESDENDSVPSIEEGKSIPLAKFQKEKKKMRSQMEAIQAELAELKANPSPKEEKVESIEAIAEKYAVNKDFLRELYGALPKNTLSSEDIALIKEFKQDMIARREAKELEKQFLSEMTALKKQDPNFSPDDTNISKLKKLKGEFPSTPLAILYKAYKEDLTIAKPKKSLESSSKEIVTEKPNFSGMTEADALKLSDADFEKWVEEQEKKDSLLKK